MSKPLGQEPKPKRKQTPRGSRNISLDDARRMADAALKTGAVCNVTRAELKIAERLLLDARSEVAASALSAEVDRRDDLLDRLIGAITIVG